MSVAELTTRQPLLQVVRADSGDEAYFLARRFGITGTEMREWQSPAKRRAIIIEKVTGEHDFRSNHYFAHGNFRESFISAWAASAHGVVHTTGLYAHADNPRHLCTPDGYLAGFTEGYAPGPDGVTVEIKTTSKDLLPGKLDANRVLISVAPEGHFAKMKYMRQIQWQMYVMNAGKSLFIWEPFIAERDRDTGHFQVPGLPLWCVIPRDQKIIDALVAEADNALEQIDGAVLSNMGGLPPVSEVPTEEAMLLADLFAARDAAATAEAARLKAWTGLEALYADRADFSEDKGFALVTRSAGKGGTRTVIDTAGMTKKAPALVAKYANLLERFTSTESTPPGKSRLSISDRRGKD